MYARLLSYQLSIVSMCNSRSSAVMLHCNKACAIYWLSFISMVTDPDISPCEQSSCRKNRGDASPEQCIISGLLVTSQI